MMTEAIVKVSPLIVEHPDAHPASIKSPWISLRRRCRGDSDTWRKSMMPIIGEAALHRFPARVLAFLICVLLALAGPSAVAQDTQASVDPHPLRPADTSSPRNTLHSFNADITAAMQARRAGAPLEVAKRAAHRALDTFDFSKLPESGFFTAEVEAALRLKEILDRIDLPPEDAIPGDDAVSDPQKPLKSWTIPDTRITIARVEEGPRAGEFLFTAETVARLEEYYDRVKTLAYKPGALVGIYDEVAHNPGWIVPRAWAAALPEWSRKTILGQDVWQWLGLAIVGITAFVLIRRLLRLGRRWDKRHRGVAGYRRLGLPLAVIAGIGIVYACRLIFTFVLRLYGDIAAPLSFVLWSLIFAGVGWLVLLVNNRIADAINEARRVKEGSIDSQLVRIVLRLISVVILVILVIYAAGFFGVPLTPVIASLGVGGLAIALAVRPTLENIIGGLVLFADKPVRIGDYCSFGHGLGTVEEIGLRSTRLRRLDDTLVSVPNADFSQRELVNYTRRRRRLFETTLGLRYETTPEQLRYVLVKLRELLLGHPRVAPENLHVRLSGFGAYSLDVKVFAYLRVTDWLESLAIAEDINLRVMDIICGSRHRLRLPVANRLPRPRHRSQRRAGAEGRSRGGGVADEGAIAVPGVRRGPALGEGGHPRLPAARLARLPSARRRVGTRPEARRRSAATRAQAGRPRIPPRRQLALALRTETVTSPRPAAVTPPKSPEAIPTPRASRAPRPRERRSGAAIQVMIQPAINPPDGHSGLLPRSSPRPAPLPATTRNPMCGRLPVGKGFPGVSAVMVGAAMCPAC